MSNYKGKVFIFMLLYTVCSHCSTFQPQTKCVSSDSFLSKPGGVKENKMLPALLVTLGCVIFQVNPGFGCQLPTEWRPLSESCRAELAEIIVYARVLAIHQEVYGANAYNHLPYQYDGTDDGLFYSAEIELLCDQAWGSMLEVPAGSRLNITGLGYFSCQSHTVVQNYSYIFFLR